MSESLTRLTRAIAVVGFSALAIVSILTMVDATLRHLGLARIPGFGDVGEVIFAIVIASCFPIGLLKGQNIRITLLGDRFMVRARPWFEVVAASLTLVFFVAVAFQFVLMTLDLQASNRVTSTVRLPVAPWWWLSTLIMLMTIPVQAWVVLESVRNAVKSGST